MAYISGKISRGLRAALFPAPTGAALVGACASGILVVSCLTDFPQPIEDGGMVSTTDPRPTEDRDAEVSYSTGTSGNSSLSPEGGVVIPDASQLPNDGGMGTASTSGATVAPTSSTDGQTTLDCPDGTIECDGACVAGNSCCSTSCATPNATSECRDEQCVIVACNAPFVDCDGEFGNGCEQDMSADDAPIASEDDPFPVPHFDFQMGLSEIDYRAWIGVPRFNLASGCGTCESGGPPPEVPAIKPSVNQGKVPGANDLVGNYSLAWDETGLWVNLVVIDNELLSSDAAGSTGDARLYDNLMVVWEPNAGASNPGTGDDHIAFIGIDEQITDWRAADTEGIEVAVKGAGQCRSIHAYFRRQYLFRSNGSAPNTFEPGDRHALVVAYNDWDMEPGTTVPQREHVVFGVDMTFASGTDYFQGERTLPQLQLIAP